MGHIVAGQVQQQQGIGKGEGFVIRLVRKIFTGIDCDPADMGQRVNLTLQSGPRSFDGRDPGYGQRHEEVADGAV